MKRVILVAWAAAAWAAPQRAADLAPLRKALQFHASFDRGIDADLAAGDRRLFTAKSYKSSAIARPQSHSREREELPRAEQERGDAQPGLGNPDVVLSPGKGRFGGALEFRKRNRHAIYYAGEKNVPYTAGDWSGTVSFWLSLDPETDLEPGYCDPIQITDKDYNDAAIWVDFTRDDKPRHFRLGVFGDLRGWNPGNVPPDKNPDFLKRLVVVERTPFARGRWTHVVIAWSHLGGGKGAARLYLDGKPQGSAEAIREPFTVEPARNAIRLGVSYAGLYDDVALFNRALTDPEVAALHDLKDGAAALHR
jgi:hypothetical protein